MGRRGSRGAEDMRTGRGCPGRRSGRGGRSGRAGRGAQAGRRTRLILSAVLAFVLLVPLSGPALSAQPLPSQPRSSVFSDVFGDKAFYFDFLGSIGIFSGDRGPGGPARPEGVLTRSEFAVIVVRLLGAEAAAARLAGDEPPFADAGETPAWARGAVNYCAAQDILRGSPGPDGSAPLLRPLAPVQGAESLAMLIRALDNDRGLTGYWPSNYMLRAYEIGLLTVPDDPRSWRTIGPVTELTRAQMALLTYNAFFCGRGYDPAYAGSPEALRRPSLASGRTGYGQVRDVDPARRVLELVGGQFLPLAGRVTLYGSSSFEGLLGRRVFYARAGSGEVAYLRAPGTPGAVEGVVARAAGRSPADGLDLVLADGGRTLPVSRSALVRLNGSLHEPSDPLPDLPLTGALVRAVTEDGLATYLDLTAYDIPEALLLRWDPPPAAPDAEGAAGSWGTGGTRSVGEATGGVRGTVTLRLASGEVVTLTVPAEARLQRGGDPVALEDLRELSVVAAATRGCAGKEALLIRVGPGSFVRTLLEVATSYTSPGEFVTEVVVPSPGGEPVDYPVEPWVLPELERLTPGEDIRLTLNWAGRVTYIGDHGPCAGHPTLVKIERVLERTGSLLVTVDHRGQAYTLEAGPATVSASSFSPGSLGRINVGPDGQVIAFIPLTLDAAFYEIYYVGEDTLGLGRHGRFWAVGSGDLVVYESLPGAPTLAGAYLGLDALRPGDIVFVDNPSAPSVLLIYRPTAGG